MKNLPVAFLIPARGPRESCYGYATSLFDLGSSGCIRNRHDEYRRDGNSNRCAFYRCEKLCRSRRMPSSITARSIEGAKC